MTTWTASNDITGVLHLEQMQLASYSIYSTHGKNRRGARKGGTRKYLY